MVDTRDAILITRIAQQWARPWGTHAECIAQYAQHVNACLYVPTHVLSGKATDWDRAHYQPLADVRDALALELL